MQKNEINRARLLLYWILRIFAFISFIVLCVGLGTIGISSLPPILEIIVAFGVWWLLPYWLSYWLNPSENKAFMFKHWKI